VLNNHVCACVGGSHEAFFGAENICVHVFSCQPGKQRAVVCTCSMHLLGHLVPVVMWGTRAVVSMPAMHESTLEAR